MEKKWKVKDLNPVQKEYYKITAAWVKLHLLLAREGIRDLTILDALWPGIELIDDYLNKQDNDMRNKIHEYIDELKSLSELERNNTVVYTIDIHN